MQRPSNYRKHVDAMARGTDQNKQIMGMVVDDDTLLLFCVLCFLGLGTKIFQISRG
jgi:hypothetical protein